MEAIPKESGDVEIEGLFRERFLSTLGSHWALDVKLTGIPSPGRPCCVEAGGRKERMCHKDRVTHDERPEERTMTPT